MENIYDVIIVGGGPAGLTAALYLARAKYRVLVLEKDQIGGQIAITEEVVNYPGIPKTSGRELTHSMKQQAEAFGAEFRFAEAIGFDLDGDMKTVRTTNGDYQCLGILLAIGAQPRPVGFQGEEQYKGRGVAYCATCDGEFFTDREIFVIGGGYAAAEESVFLTKFARHVTILIRKDDFSCARSVAEEAWNHEKITVLTNTVMEEVSGEAGLNYARYRNTKTGEITEYRSAEGDHFGVFVLAGYAPATGFLKGTVELNEQGYILTDNSLKTSAEGVYAAGDVCIKPLRQVVTATSDGALAATELEKYVAAVQKKTGISSAKPPKAPVEDSDEKQIISQDLANQLTDLFERMENSLILKLYLDDRSVSKELEEFTVALTNLTDKLSILVAHKGASSDVAPCARVCRGDGSWTGLAFHGIPGGHEFTSFVMGLYNAAGPGQKLDSEIRERIAGISRNVDIQVLVTLSCTMCPDTVIATQQIAALNPNVTAEIFDVRHFEELRKKYNVMSVPCIVINGEVKAFGKQSLPQLLDLML